MLVQTKVRWRKNKNYNQPKWNLILKLSPMSIYHGHTFTTFSCTYTFDNKDSFQACHLLISDAEW